METAESNSLLKTPLYQEHLKLNAKMLPFGGWLMPIQYEGIINEHEYTRKQVSIFDICHMGEFIIEGDAVLSGLDRIITQRITSMVVGSCRYGFMLNENAGIIDDLVVYRLDKNSWMLVVNAATTQEDEKHLRAELKGKFSLQNISNSMGKIDIQGPQSLEVLKKLVGSEIEKLEYYRFAKFTLLDEKVIISRTGYTGELGFEIYISNEKVVALWKTLLENPQVKPAGLGARDTLRLEMGYPLYGQDLDKKHNPHEAGYDRFVDLKKDFIGKQFLLNPNATRENLVYFVSTLRRAPRHGFGIYKAQEKIGIVTSGSFSPSLQVGIGMGYVSKEISLGEDLLIKEGNIEIPVKATQLPFYTKGTARI